MKSLSLSQPHVIIMVGVPGSGKTFFAEKFAETFHAPYVSPAKIAALIGGDISSIDKVMQYQFEELLKTQQSIILDGNADTRAARAELHKKAHKAGYETLVIWVQTDPATAKSRSLKDRQDGQTLTSNIFEQRVKRFTPPIAIEKPIVISGKHTYATQAKAVLKKLSEPRTEISSHVAPPVRREPTTRRNIIIR